MVKCLRLYRIAVILALLSGASAWSQQRYFIMNQNSGRVLDVTGGSSSQAYQNATALQQYDWLGGANQQWILSPLANGYYEIINVQSGKVLDVRSVSLNPSAVIQQYDWLGGANQQWQLIDNGDGTRKIVNLNSRLVLDVDGERADNSAGIVQENDLTSKYEQPSIKWIFIPVDSAGQTAFFPSDGSNDATFNALKGTCSVRPAVLPVFRSWPCGASVKVYMFGFRKDEPLQKAVNNWNAQLRG